MAWIDGESKRFTEALYCLETPLDRSAISSLKF